MCSNPKGFFYSKILCAHLVSATSFGSKVEVPYQYANMARGFHEFFYSKVICAHLGRHFGSKEEAPLTRPTWLSSLQITLYVVKSS